MKQFGLKSEQIDVITQCFAQYPAIEQVILYGSRAKGNFKDGSDIDLTIIDDGMTFSDLLQLENKLDDLLLPYKIDLSLKRQINNAELLNHIERVGKLFYKHQR
ncbi:MAG: nucleotidyltransferase domain-containing protein [Victivallaceae bacterium]|jgi:predicted nucleotidyltransferase